MVRVLLTLVSVLLAVEVAAAEREAYFGDLHVHTQYSMDVFRFGTRTTPQDAYRFARGEAIQHPAGFAVQLDRPLDFYAVADHAGYFGALAAFNEPDHPLHDRARELGVLDLATVFGDTSARPSGTTSPAC